LLSHATCAATYWSSWFATSYASMVIVSLLVSLAGMYPFRYTDWTVMFVFLVGRCRLPLSNPR
jgi:hypothetical protein